MIPAGSPHQSSIVLERRGDRSGSQRECCRGRRGRGCPALGGGVLVSPTPLADQGLLQVCVLHSVSLMAAQPLSEQTDVCLCPLFPVEDVPDRGPHTVDEQERAPVISDDHELAPACTHQRGGGVLHTRALRHPQREVNHRLGHQAGHGRRAHVLHLPLWAERPAASQPGTVSPRHVREGTAARPQRCRRAELRREGPGPGSAAPGPVDTAPP